MEAGNRLNLHGWYFDIEHGQLLRYDATTRDFVSAVITLELWLAQVLMQSTVLLIPGNAAFRLRIGFNRFRFFLAIFQILLQLHNAFFCCGDIIGQGLRNLPAFLGAAVVFLVQVIDGGLSRFDHGRIAIDACLDLHKVAVAREVNFFFIREAIQ